MSMDLYCRISLILFLIGCSLSLIMKRQRADSLKCRTELIGTAAAAAFILYFGALTTAEGSSFLLLRNLVSSILKTFKLFMLGCDDSFLQIYEQLRPETRAWYCIYGPLLYLLAPLLTIAMVLSLFRDISARRRLLLHPGKPVYAFSALNTRSLMLAESIHKKDPQALICFAGNRQEELEDQAEDLGALLFKKEIGSVSWNSLKKGRELSLFSVSDDPQKCTQEALLLREKYGGCPNAALYVFSSDMDSRMLFSINEGCRMRIRRIDPIRSMLNNTLFHQGHLLFSGAMPLESGDKLISAVILGLGKQGSEMVKSLSWLCQMDGYQIHIHVFDRDPQAEQRFLAACPELMSPERNGTEVPGEACYQISIHSGVSTDSCEFGRILRNIGPVTYVLTALGSDRDNVEAAVRVRMLCLQNGCRPLIHSIVYSSLETTLLQKATDYRGHAYDISFIGCLRDFYDWNRLSDDTLEQLALKRHLQWGDEASFWAYEFNYQSSVASAIHAKMRTFCQIPGAGLPEDQITSAQRTALEKLEHRRWNAYMRSDGWCYSGSPDPCSRNDLAKLHNDLIPYGELSRQEQAKDFAGSL